MRTRIEVYTIANPDNVVTSGEWNRKLLASEIKKELKDLYRWLDPKKHAHRIIIL